MAVDTKFSILSDLVHYIITSRQMPIRSELGEGTSSQSHSVASMILCFATTQVQINFYVIRFATLCACRS